MPRKSITFAEKQNEWLKYVVSQGYYKDESDYVRDLVRRDQASNAEFYALKTAIDEGYESGVSDQTLDEIWEQAEKENKAEQKE